MTAWAAALLTAAAVALLIAPPGRLAAWPGKPRSVIPGRRTWPGQRQAPPGPASDPVMWLELLGSLLESGASLERGLEHLAAVEDEGAASGLQGVAAALRLGAGWDTAWQTVRPAPALAVLREALSFAVATGAPSATILYARAEQLRRRRHRAMEAQAAALGVRLVLPLGLCALPAFICLGVVPVLLSLLPPLG